MSTAGFTVSLEKDVVACLEKQDIRLYIRLLQLGYQTGKRFEIVWTVAGIHTDGNSRRPLFVGMCDFIEQ